MEKPSVTKIILAPELPKVVDWVLMRDGTCFVSPKIPEIVKGGANK